MYCCALPGAHGSILFIPSKKCGSPQQTTSWGSASNNGFALLTSLKKIQGIVEKNPVIPIASNLLLQAKKGEIVLSATNFEVGIIVKSSVSVSAEGEIIVDAQKFFEIIREMPDGAISVVKKDAGWIAISYGNSILFNLAVLSEEHYPPIVTDTKVTNIEIEAKNIAELIQRTVYACSDDRTRDALRGILIEKHNGLLRMVATDGHRLACAERTVLKGENNEIPSGIIIPKKGAKEIKRLAQELDEKEGLEVGFGEKNITIKKGEETLIVRLIEGDFPDYKRVIPESTTKKIILTTKDIIESLKRVTLVAEEETRAVKFSIHDGLLVISSKKIGTGDAREERPVEYRGEDIEFGLNSKYLLDVVTALDGEEISLEVQDNKTPVLIKEKDSESTIAVIMPMIL
jgi:DNA polymerase-3 subunit beta